MGLMTETELSKATTDLCFLTEQVRTLSASICHLHVIVEALQKDLPEMENTISELRNHTRTIVSIVNQHLKP